MEIVRKYVEKFNMNDEETHKNLIDNRHAYEWLKNEIPLFECPDKEIEETYYFRYWTYRKHLKMTEDGYIVTEFLPKVSWSGRHNEINAAAGHHLAEGRWLRNSKTYLTDYVNFFLDHSDRGHQYSTWMIYAVYRFCEVTGDFDMGDGFLEKASAYYEEWERTHLLPNGLFWSYDNYDAMEYSISGTDAKEGTLPGIRPTLNSYMCADAWAIAKFAARSGNKELEKKYKEKHERLKTLINEHLYKDGFYRAFSFKKENRDASAAEMTAHPAIIPPKELIGYIPYMFGIPERDKSDVFLLLTDKNCFYTEFGIATADVTDERYLYKVDHECLWNGYIWPFATSQTLTAMGENLKREGGTETQKQNFYDLLKQYAASHKRLTEKGKIVNWIDEVRNPKKDEWSSREILKERGWKTEYGGYERGKDYNHSTFCDIVISYLLGISVKDGTLTVSPNLPASWDHCKLENLYVLGDTYSVFYDKTGEKYHKGVGLAVYKNGVRL